MPKKRVHTHTGCKKSYTCDRECWSSVQKNASMAMIVLTAITVHSKVHASEE